MAAAGSVARHQTPVKIRVKKVGEITELRLFRQENFSCLCRVCRRDKAKLCGKTLTEFLFREKQSPRIYHVGKVSGVDTSTPAGPDAAATTLSEEQTVIRQAILEHNRSADPTGFVSCASLAELACIVVDGSDFSEYTHYGWALYNEYRVTDSGLKTVSGGHVPVAITFREGPSGTLTLEEYWQPRDGSNL